MRRHGLSIIVCAITALCPALCIIELGAHRAVHDGATEAAHCHDDGDRSHHQHDSSGDPIPHGEHTCVCTGSTTPGAALQIPAPMPCGYVFTDPIDAHVLRFSGHTHTFALWSLADPRACGGAAPLLI